MYDNLVVRGYPGQTQYSSTQLLENYRSVFTVPDHYHYLEASQTEDLSYGASVGDVPLIVSSSSPTSLLTVFLPMVCVCFLDHSDSHVD